MLHKMRLRINTLAAVWGDYMKLFLLMMSLSGLNCFAETYVDLKNTPLHQDKFIELDNNPSFRQSNSNSSNELSIFSNILSLSAMIIANEQSSNKDQPKERETSLDLVSQKLQRN